MENAADKAHHKVKDLIGGANDKIEEVSNEVKSVTPQPPASISPEDEAMIDEELKNQVTGNTFSWAGPD